MRTLGEIVAEGGGFIRTGPFGLQLHQSDYVDDPNGIPVVMPKDMAQGRVDRSTIARIDQNTADRLSHHLLEEGDIALSRRGDVGRSAWIGPDDLPLLCGTGSMRVHPGVPVSVHSDYLRYFFRSRLAIDYLEGQAVGATMPNLNAGIVTGMPVPILPLKLQVIAAKVLRSLEDLIENNRRRVEVLEEMARAIYREWFVRFRYPGHEDVPLVDSPLGPIPDGWQVQPFSELASFVNGFAFKPSHWGNAGRPIIKIKQLKQGVTPDTPRCEPASIAEKYWIEPGDLLFSWSADLGVCRWSDEPGLLNQHLFVVTPNEGVSVAFLHHALDGAMPQFWDRAQGTTMRHIKRSALSEVTTSLPPDGLIRRFTEVVNPIDQEASVLGQRTRNLVALRDLLLPKLVTGQIDVSHLDLDALTEAPVA
jgi:type I restriction enzyme S subunit